MNNHIENKPVHKPLSTRGQKLLLKIMMERKEAMEAKQKPIYLSEAHRKNSEVAMEQIKIWQETPFTLDEILEKQRIRDQQAKN